MAFWDKLSSRGEVEDRRGMAPATLGGLSLTGVAIVLIVNYLAGGDLGTVLTQLENVPIQQQESNTQEFAGEDSYEVFASTVLGSTNDLWKKIFAEKHTTFVEPKLVLFRTATESACGVATSDVGPHYCPLDKTIYLDETFFNELQTRFGARGGDVAQAYVIAHEAGHHAQNELGILETANSNNQSIQLELQADCFAGLWANSIKDQQVFLPNEIEEAIDAAAAVGDDRIQKKVTGYITPETWTHGSSEQRVSWFKTGFETGSFDSCDTFK